MVTPILTQVSMVSTISTTNKTPNILGTSIPEVTTTLTENQAWSYAVPYLEKHGLVNIQPTEIKCMGQSEYSPIGKNPEITWDFEIDRTDKMGFQMGGIIGIDTYDGHVAWYTGFG
nr:hypothetical protein [uncultured Methanoregula sp.]